jgi:hypothetical protein
MNASAIKPAMPRPKPPGDFNRGRMGNGVPAHALPPPTQSTIDPAQEAAIAEAMTPYTTGGVMDDGKTPEERAQMMQEIASQLGQGLGGTAQGEEEEELPRADRRHYGNEAPRQQAFEPTPLYQDPQKVAEDRMRREEERMRRARMGVMGRPSIYDGGSGGF